MLGLKLSSRSRVLLSARALYQITLDSLFSENQSMRCYEYRYKYVPLVSLESATTLEVLILQVVLHIDSCILHGPCLWHRYWLLSFFEMRMRCLCGHGVVERLEHWHMCVRFCLRYYIVRQRCLLVFAPVLAGRCQLGLSVCVRID